VSGAVRQELRLSIQDIKSLPKAKTDAPLHCVVGWTDLALWRGTRVRDVIAIADPTQDAKSVTFRDDRGYEACLSLDYVQSGEPILAYEVNGEPLPREHGWPVRLVAPGK
jgi:DMSO/TMAO reductase YedYZ molybdopterin-dependent catalytic subunit